MNKMLKVFRIIILLAAVAGVLGACSSQTATSTSPAVSNPAPPTTPTTSVPKPEKPSELSARVDVIYFHMNQRCPTCLCFEERISNVIKTYFSDDIKSGKLTYKILNAQEPQNAAIVKKYGAVGSSLFINTVINGADNIIDIQDIWRWNCRYNPANFDQKVKDVIEQSLKSGA